MMEFAVVCFTDEQNCFAEVPRSWITNDGLSCWWPHKKSTAGSLMLKGVLPDQTWNKHTITIEGYYPTLEKARKMAQYDSPSTSADETLCRNKKRKSKKPKSIYPSSSDDESVRSITPPPQQPEATIDIVDIENIPVDILENTTEDTIVEDGAGSTVIDTTLTSDDNLLFQTHDVKHILDQIYEKVSSIELHVKSIDERLRKIEMRHPEEITKHAVLDFFIEKLPLDEIEEVKEFEGALGDEKYYNSFITFMSRIGGRNVKDNIHRLLKTCFTNKLATKCSWLGQRGNFRISDLLLIRITKNIICESYSTTEKDFEIISSEWFRLAKLRLKSSDAKM